MPAANGSDTCASKRTVRVGSVMVCIDFTSYMKPAFRFLQPVTLLLSICASSDDHASLMHRFVRTVAQKIDLYSAASPSPPKGKLMIRAQEKLAMLHRLSARTLTTPSCNIRRPESLTPLLKKSIQGARRQDGDMGAGRHVSHFLSVVCFHCGLAISFVRDLHSFSHGEP